MRTLCTHGCMHRSCRVPHNFRPGNSHIYFSLLSVTICPHPINPIHIHIQPLIVFSIYSSAVLSLSHRPKASLRSVSIAIATEEEDILLKLGSVSCAARAQRWLALTPTGVQSMLILRRINTIRAARCRTTHWPRQRRTLTITTRTPMMVM